MLVPQSSLTRRFRKNLDQQFQYLQIADEYTPTKNYIKKSYEQQMFKPSSSKKKLTLGFDNYEEIKQAYTKIKTNNLSVRMHTENNPYQSQAKPKPCDYDFVPKIREISNSIKRKRNFGQFINSQDNFIVKKNAKIDRMRVEINQMENNQCTKTPKIDKKSRKISDHLQEQQVFSRLSKQKNICQIDMFEQEGAFVPKILRKSKSLKRNQKIQNLLYEDAKRRIHKQQMIDDQASRTIRTQTCTTNRSLYQTQPAQRVSTNPNTNFLVFNKIKHEALQMLEEQEQISPILAISIISELFNIDLNPNRNASTQGLCHKVLNYLIQNTQDKIQSEKLLTFIQIIVTGYSHHQSAQQQYYDQQQRYQIYSELGYFYRQRLARQKKIKEVQLTAFHPKTLRVSARLAENHRQRKLQAITSFLQANDININIQGSNLRIQDLLLLDSIRKKAQLECRMKEQSQQQLAECSFRPNLSLKRKSRKKKEGSENAQKRVLSSETKRLKTCANQCRQFEYSDDRKHLNDKRKQGKKAEHNIQGSNNETAQFGVEGKEKKRKKIVLKGTKKDDIKDFDKNLLRMSIGRKQRDYAEKSKQRGYPKNQNYVKKIMEEKKYLTQQQNLNRGFY